MLPSFLPIASVYRSCNNYTRSKTKETWSTKIELDHLIHFGVLEIVYAKTLIDAASLNIRSSRGFFYDYKSFGKHLAQYPILILLKLIPNILYVNVVSKGKFELKMIQNMKHSNKN